MKIQDLTENDVVRCTTEEQAKTLLQAAHELGYKWGNGRSFLEYDEYSTYKGETCYDIKRGEFSPFRYYHSEGFNIIPFEQMEFNNMKKEINIEIPKGYEIDKENSTFEKIVFKKINPLDALPTKWEDVEYNRDVFFIKANSEIGSSKLSNAKRFRNSLTTKYQAEAMLAFMQLCFLRDIYNGEPLENWVDWSTASQKKYVVLYNTNKVIKEYAYCFSHPIAFKTEELRDKFFDNFQDLLEKAKIYL